VLEQRVQIDVGGSGQIANDAFLMSADSA